VTGYLHEAYARSLAEFGTPRFLPHSKGWILEREIRGSQYRDAMGCYPIFACQNWQLLQNDVETLSNDIVALSVVTDPFGDYDEHLLRSVFPDRMQPFKEHYVVDLRRDLESYVHPHHQRNARKAKDALQLEQVAQPLDFLDDWTSLYEQLVRRHGITGISAFSRTSFAIQLQVPGLIAFRAVLDGKTEGMLLWYVQNTVAYYHLGAYSERGYDLRASFALFSHAIQYFQSTGLRWLNLGGAAGAGESTTQGLGRFKKGWSTGVRTAYFCGRIIDPDSYDGLVAGNPKSDGDYFPAYRAGEFR
jgi:hypothetical protein